jgi:hypothetical protein
LSDITETHTKCLCYGLREYFRRVWSNKKVSHTYYYKLLVWVYISSKNVLCMWRVAKFPMCWDKCICVFNMWRYAISLDKLTTWAYILWKNMRFYSVSNKTFLDTFLVVCFERFYESCWNAHVLTSDPLRTFIQTLTNVLHVYWVLILVFM